MTPPTFDVLAGFFAKLADEQERKLKALNPGIDFRLGPNWLRSLRMAYEDETKNAIKCYTKSGSSTRLDRHKIAAALVMATLRTIPFGLLKQDDQASHRCREANVFLAIDIGCIVIVLFGIVEARDTANADLGKVYGDTASQLFAIATGNGDGDYRSQLVKAINFARQAEGPIPDGYALLLAHIFFLLQCAFERRQCLKHAIDPDDDSMNLAARMVRIDALEKGHN